MAPPAEPSTESATSIDTGETDNRRERFETASLDSDGGMRQLGRWLLPLLAGVTVFGLVLSGVHAVRSERAVLSLAGQQVSILNWMYGLALAFIAALLAGRLYASPGRVKPLLARLRARTVVFICAVYAAVLFVAGSVAPFVISEPGVDPLISHQPPLWRSVSDFVPPTCHGAVVDGQCQGTVSYLFGTNAAGQDIAQVGLLGLNTTLQVAVTASVITATLGISVGVVAGYLGGRTDELLMRYVDIQRALPAFFVYILLILVFERSYPLLILVFGLLSWGGIARLVRSEVAQLRTTPFVRAARQSGAGSFTIIKKHILPALTGTVLTAIAVVFAKFVVYEASLAFLALTDISVTSLGNEIARAVGREGADPVGGSSAPLYDWWYVPWTIYVPAGVLCTLLLAVSLLGDSVQEIVDPRM